jgi:c-di-GMP-binding flagellar brake protein YcgR
MFGVDQQIILETPHDKFKTVVRGERPQGWLLLDYAKTRPRLDRGAPVTAKTILNGEMLSFQCQALGVMAEIDLLALAWPETITRSPFRKDRRYHIAAPATVETGGVKQEGLIHDFSAGGCSLTLHGRESRLTIGDRLHLSGVFHGYFVTRLPAAVKNRAGEERSPVYGLAFDTTGVDTRRLLNKIDALLCRLDDDTLAPPPDESDTPFGVGERLNLQIGQNRLATPLRGWRTDKLILTDRPSVDGKPIIADQSSDLEATVRFLSRGTIYGFATRLVRQYTAPIPLWAWSYPTDLERVGLRKSERLRLLMGGAVAVESGEEATATLIDLSQDGALVAADTKKTIAVGDTVQLAFTLPDSRKIAGLACKVAQVRVAPNVSYLGLAFADHGGRAHREVVAYYEAERSRRATPAPKEE